MVEELEKIDVADFQKRASDEEIGNMLLNERREKETLETKSSEGRKEEFLETDKFKNKKSKGKKILKFFFFVFIFLIIWLFLNFFWFQSFLKTGKKAYTEINDFYSALKNQDLIAAEEKIKIAENSFNLLQKKYQKFFWLKTFPFVRNYYKDGESLFKAGSYGFEAGTLLIEAVTPYADILGFKGQGSFMGQTAEERIVKIIQTVDKLVPKIEEATLKLSFAEEEIKKIKPYRYPEKFKGKDIRDKIEKAQFFIISTIDSLREAKPLITVLPQILGYPDKKNYLLIFQNDGELRATGGFMTAYSILKIDSGKVRAEKSDDIYSLDRELNSRLKPPEPIKNYLFNTEYSKSIVPYYYLRDMNFSPDFKISMDTFYQNLEKIKNMEKIDGIIALDTFFLTSLINVLGPINVPGYGEFTNEPDKRCHNIANIICELEYLVDQPLPSQDAGRKKSILGPMMQEIMFKALGSSKNLWPSLFNTGLKALKEKHILLYFVNPDLQKAAETYGAAGRIVEYQHDYLHINDSNFGGAKSNLFTKHFVKQEIEISETGKISKTLTLIYENPEPVDNCNLERKSGLCLNSILRNYLRVYVPYGSKLVESLGTEKPMETKEELGKTYFDGFLIVHGAGGRSKVIIKYELPFKINFNEKYKLLIQKQPGTKGHDYSVIFGNKEENFQLTEDRELIFNW